ncbi:hypothetical protein Pla175_43710 [Pirellulimonas nuda]|uniref:Uncharacterized protein n=1 Tax=Pirellulimonas nuda TaxID=2528009 RepID=A0A518DHK6_9BACT|nr:hypothetical protein Pla175_43710 [Pirellulimonas nuda]
MAVEDSGAPHLSDIYLLGSEAALGALVCSGGVERFAGQGWIASGAAAALQEGRVGGSTKPADEGAGGRASLLAEGEPSRRDEPWGGGDGGSPFTAAETFFRGPSRGGSGLSSHPPAVATEG